MSRSLNMNLHLRAFSIAIHQKFDLSYFVPIQTVFWSANCKILVCKLCLLFQTIFDLWPVLILEIFNSWDIRKGQFQFLVVFFLVHKLYIRSGNQVCMSSHILNMESVLFEGLQNLVF